MKQKSTIDLGNLIIHICYVHWKWDTGNNLILCRSIALRMQRQLIKNYVHWTNKRNKINLCTVSGERQDQEVNWR